MEWYQLRLIGQANFREEEREVREEQRKPFLQISLHKENEIQPFH